jgi:hypothetical protein
MNRSALVFERAVRANLGGESSLFHCWCQAWGSPSQQALEVFDPDLAGQSFEQVRVQGYLIALVREMLLEAVEAGGSARLAELPWGGEWGLPDWRALEDALAPIGPSLLRDGLDRAGWPRISAVDRASIDLVGVLHEHLRESAGRKRAGEFYTPAWLADRVVAEVWKSGVRWLDPTSGGGAFVRAVTRHAIKLGEPLPTVVGLDRSPFGVLASACAVAWGQRATQQPISLSVGQVDVLATALPARAGRFERLVGNPPWILWDSFDDQQRERMAAVWDGYELRLETGMGSILGGGKRDLASLVLLRSMDHWLAEGGRGGFVVPQSLFKSTAAGRGLRQWRLPDGTPLRVDRVDDLSRLRPFANASVKASLLFCSVGHPTTYPVDYRIWRRSDGSKIEQAWAWPSDPADPLSHWRHEESHGPIEQAPSIWGQSQFQARLGVNVGGASGIYWLRLLAKESEQIWRLANLADRGRHTLPSGEVLLETELLYPVLLGRDLQPWEAVPSAWLLLAQDPQSRRGWPVEWMAEHAPRALAYLSSFENFLRSRAAYKRFFLRRKKEGEVVELAPYYSLFNVGPYTLAPIKVVWNRMGRRLSAAVVTTHAGRPVLPQETHAFAVVDSLAEGDFLAACLNSRPVGQALQRMHVVSSKSFATPRVIHSLALERYDANRPTHRSMAQRGEEARQTRAAGLVLSPSWAEEFEATSQAYWAGRKSE